MILSRGGKLLQSRQLLFSLYSSAQACDSRLRCGTMDLYFALYGRRRPACIPATNTDALSSMPPPQQQQQQQQEHPQYEKKYNPNILVPRPASPLGTINAVGAAVSSISGAIDDPTAPLGVSKFGGLEKVCTVDDLLCNGRNENFKRILVECA